MHSSESRIMKNFTYTKPSITLKEQLIVNTDKQSIYILCYLVFHLNFKLMIEEFLFLQFV